jgi:hypothetical protein
VEAIGSWIAIRSSTERPHPVAHGSDADGEEGVTDLYGNDVTSAVATYKLDVDGSLYEAHSPRTQLPRLGSPKS